MKHTSRPENESERMNALRATELLDTHSERAFDTLVGAVAKLLDVPVALATLVDDDRQWFKARIGIESIEAATELSQCGQSIMAEGPMVVPDALQDPRLREGALVVGPPHLRFFAGVPLLLPTGEAVGTLCVADTRPRTLSAPQLEALEALATQVMSLVELRVLNAMVRRSNERLKQKNATLRRAQAMIESSPDTMIVVDRNGLCQDLSATILLPWESEPHEQEGVVGKTLTQLFDDFGDELAAHVKAAIDRGMTAEFERSIARDGKRMHLLALVSRCRDGEALVVVRDVTRQRELAQLKDEFTSMIAHEIRTPLSSIRASLRLLDAGVMGALNPEQEELVSISTQSAERLSRLVNDVLDLERLSRGPIELQRAWLDAGALVQRSARELAALAGAARVGMVVESMPGFELEADSDRLQQAIVNLLGNAVRFSPPGAVVTARVDAAAPGLVRLSVRDRGPGIAREQQSRLFQRFERLDRSNGGTGLGLAIVRAIVEQHGGRVGVDSEPGQGATFWIELAGKTPSQRALAERWSREAVAEAREEFVGTLAVMETELRALGERVESVDGLEALRRLAHRVAGTAGSCGLGALSTAARAVEEACVDGASAEDVRARVATMARVITATRVEGTALG